MSISTIAGNVFSATIVDVSWTPTAVSTITAPVQTVTVPGAKVGDFVYVTPPGQTAGVTIGSARVSATDTVSVQFVNPTVGSVTPAAGTHKFLVICHEGVNGSTAVLN